MGSLSGLEDLPGRQPPCCSGWDRARYKFHQLTSETATSNQAQQFPIELVSRRSMLGLYSRVALPSDASLPQHQPQRTTKNYVFTTNQWNDGQQWSANICKALVSH